MDRGRVCDTLGINDSQFYCAVTLRVTSFDFLVRIIVQSLRLALAATENHVSDNICFD